MPLTTDPPPPVLLLTQSQAARSLGVSVRTMRNLTAPRGPIPVLRIGGVLRYRVATLEAWTAGAEMSRPAPPPSRKATR